MPSMSNNDLNEYLSKYGQEHLVKFWDELNENEQEILIDDIKSTDFEEINKLFKRIEQDKNETTQLLDKLMKPVPDELKGSFSHSTKAELDKYEMKGLEAIANNEVAVLLLAGGQGTRLGVSYPKGMYSVDLPSKKTLYQLQAERILRMEQLSESLFQKHGTVPWYIMTSEHTQESTKAFFKKHNQFGLQTENIIFFEQNTLPCLSYDGKIFLEEKYKLSKAPDGNGGLYRALYRQKIIDNMLKRGIKYIHVYCVDNILVKMADPIFIGFCIEKNANCAAKVVRKAFPEEAVGVICKVNDRFQVVEYSEISTNTAKELNEKGELKFNAGNICNHFLTTEFLNTLCSNHECELKHHIAEKKIPYIDENGVRQTPSKPNGIKLEKFVFDVFPFSTNFAIWEVIREFEFSPLKNADGAKKDTPTTCKNDLLSMHYNWLQLAGAKFNLKNNDFKPICEISPLVSYNGEGLFDYVNGKCFESPLVIEYDSENQSVHLNGCQFNKKI